MRDMWVRGIFYRQVLKYIKQRRGQTSYDLLGMDIDKYKIEEKYDFEDFMTLLSKIKLITSGEEDYIAKISRETMTEEATWKNLFRRMDPTSVFASTQRQDGRHQLADYKPVIVADGHVVIKMNMWTDNLEHQNLWAEFYQGRLEGILELMGRKGSVKQVREFGNGIFTYTVEWV
ncbi:MAG: hypothetical protein KKH41_06200 [Candidatus Thermoplasmatota archaeon]|nr:hypothetical protein [Euryarchaeota archaeon]MBU4032349.1 hypothetical protein [Candidatus Thermoplasmatota archaeon]MBU4071752.1 hypothetical protein [Candidatus Thermoplasmatota archaeon]MBU4144846.1 hypothetical protein [Candidatus Thermoplasmatota archaeon]MBU4592159.1 hypothetical protein [Candidatus Thermoplasmatota archaeon]